MEGTVTVTGMEAFWTAVLAAITPDKLWAVFTGAVGFIAVAVIFTFGYRMARKLLKGISSGTTGV